MLLRRPNYARTTGSEAMRRLLLRDPVLVEKITVIGPEEWILGEWNASDDPSRPSALDGCRRSATAHGFGCGAVYGLQHGACVGANSMNSTRVASGS